MTAMTEPAEPELNTRRGCLIFWLLIAVVVAGVVTVVKLWPDSLEKRRDTAQAVCQDAVERQAPTEWRKLWQGSAFEITGDNPITVTGEFATKDTGFRQFTCTVDDGKVTAVTVQP